MTQNLMPSKSMKNLTGQKHGRLTIVEYAGQARFKHALWRCQCECGTVKVLLGYTVTNGNTKSCGQCGSRGRSSDSAPRDAQHFRDKLRASSIVNSNGCWVWQKAKIRTGYGRISVNRKLVYTHILSHRLFKADVPAGMCVLHTCDNPSCVNPEHLFLGTQQDNIKDKMAKGRQAFGEHGGSAKLSASQVLQIREMYTTGLMTKSAIAREMNVANSTVRSIIDGLTWKHLLN